MAGSTKLLTSSGGGVILTPATNIAADVTVSIPSQTCTLGIQGPAFSAYQSVAQTLATSTLTKIQFQTKEFDTNNNYDNTTNYRFTPTVAGYYQVSAALAMASAVCGVQLVVYKNGAVYKYIFNTVSTTVTNGGQGSCLVYLNGSTDYIEIYGLFSTGQNTFANSQYTFFQAALVRSA